LFSWWGRFGKHHVLRLDLGHLLLLLLLVCAFER
jgi:hypothetical protein